MDSMPLVYYYYFLYKFTILNDVAFCTISYTRNKILTMKWSLHVSIEMMRNLFHKFMGV